MPQPSRGSIGGSLEIRVLVGSRAIYVEMYVRFARHQRFQGFAKNCFLKPMLKPLAATGHSSVAAQKVTNHKFPCRSRTFTCSDAGMHCLTPVSMAESLSRTHSQNTNMGIHTILFQDIVHVCLAPRCDRPAGRFSPRKSCRWMCGFVEGWSFSSRNCSLMFCHVVLGSTRMHLELEEKLGKINESCNPLH